MVKLRLSIFQEHGDDLLKIAIQFIERLALGVRVRKTRYKADKQASFGTTLDHRRVNSHKPTSEVQMIGDYPVTMSIRQFLEPNVDLGRMTKRGTQAAFGRVGSERQERHRGLSVHGQLVPLLTRRHSVEGTATRLLVLNQPPIFENPSEDREKPTLLAVLFALLRHRGKVQRERVLDLGSWYPAVLR